MTTFFFQSQVGGFSNPINPETIRRLFSWRGGAVQTSLTLAVGVPVSVGSHEDVSSVSVPSSPSDSTITKGKGEGGEEAKHVKKSVFRDCPTLAALKKPVVHNPERHLSCACGTTSFALCLMAQAQGSRSRVRLCHRLFDLRGPSLRFVPHGSCTSPGGPQSWRPPLLVLPSSPFPGPFGLPPSCTLLSQRLPSSRLLVLADLFPCLLVLAASTFSSQSSLRWRPSFLGFLAPHLRHAVLIVRLNIKHSVHRHCPSLAAHTGTLPVRKCLRTSTSTLSG